MDVLEAIKSRRSVRRFKPDEVEEWKLREVLEAARWAPSWANTQCWRLVVVKDGKVKEKLAEAVPEGNRGRRALLEAPVVIALCAERGRSGFIRGLPGSDKGDWWFMFDAALAAQNLTLAAHALGLGTLHIGWMDTRRAAQVLGVPEGYELIELIPVGYPAEQPQPPPRRSLEEQVYAEKFGQRYFKA
ncbi:MAG: nitroreductase family protein [Candidatus Nezhaarchaeota archaeon]|nr:nitroreductase family protein [Candidatus Nezhaarchaeota archaeon]